MAHGSAVRSMAVLGSCLGTLASAGGCSGGAKATGHQPWSYQGQRGISAVLAPADATLYRALLPQAFGMPESPRIVVAVVSYDSVTSPLVPYHEGYVMLACTYRGAAGWYTLTMPVDDPTACDAGLGIGFPKYLADRIELTDGGGGAWTGEVVHQGRSVIHVAFAPQGAPETTTGRPAEPGFNLVPPGAGPAIYEVRMTFHETQLVTAIPGTVVIEFGVDEPWARLVAQAEPVSAQVVKIAGDWNLAPQEQ